MKVSDEKGSLAGSFAKAMAGPRSGFLIVIALEDGWFIQHVGGYAPGLTNVLIDPAISVVLSPSTEASNLYRRLGFEQVGQLTQWHRP